MTPLNSVSFLFIQELFLFWKWKHAVFSLVVTVPKLGRRGARGDEEWRMRPFGNFPWENGRWASEKVWYKIANWCNCQKIWCELLTEIWSTFRPWFLNRPGKAEPRDLKLQKAYQQKHFWDCFIPSSTALSCDKPADQPQSVEFQK
jgi:hypothetical protein